MHPRLPWGRAIVAARGVLRTLLRPGHHGLEAVEGQEAGHGPQVNAVFGKHPLEIARGLHHDVAHSAQGGHHVHEYVGHRDTGSEGEEPPVARVAGPISQASAEKEDGGEQQRDDQ